MQEAESELVKMREALRQIADENNWFDDCGEWEWLVDHPDGGDDFEGAMGFAKRALLSPSSGDKDTDNG
jgi:hypothetical protein